MTNSARHDAIAALDVLDSEDDADFDRLVRLTAGPSVTEPAELGFGSRLIQRSLDKILDSEVTLEFPPSGIEA